MKKRDLNIMIFFCITFLLCLILTFFLLEIQRRVRFFFENKIHQKKILKTQNIDKHSNQDKHKKKHIMSIFCGEEFSLLYIVYVVILLYMNFHIIH